jgi:hypothetical protein
MYLVKSIAEGLGKNVFLFFSFLFIHKGIFAQENSPYSRYGVGDILPNQNIATRAMGGISAGYSDFGLVGSPFNLNLNNPASLGDLSHTKNFSNTIFDLGGEVDVRTLRSNTNFDKFRATNVIQSYLQVGFPIATNKMERRGMQWGVSFGLRPLNRINYKIEQNRRIPGVDSINTMYEGSGGINQVNVSTGFKIIGKGTNKNELNIGLSSGYTFGNRDYSSKTSLINDTIPYYKSNYQSKSRYGGFFLTAGLQYEMHLKNAGNLRLGAYSNFQHNLTAYQNSINETYGFDGNGGTFGIDSVFAKKDAKGIVTLPSTYGVGFTYQSNNRHWLIGADYEWSNWNDYRYYNEREYTASNWTARAGVEFYPANPNTAATNKYWSYVKYRAGFYYGSDYIKINNTRYNYAATMGLSLPLTTPRYIQTRGEFVCLNTTVEIGGRGNKQSLGLRENFVRFSFGISMNARWFQKRSYD